MATLLFFWERGANGATAAGGGSITYQIRPANANKYFAVYAQDNFKVNRKLTVNAGLRWDLSIESRSGTITSLRSTHTSRIR